MENPFSQDGMLPAILTSAVTPGKRKPSVHSGLVGDWEGKAPAEPEAARCLTCAGF